MSVSKYRLVWLVAKRETAPRLPHLDVCVEVLGTIYPTWRRCSLPGWQMWPRAYCPPWAQGRGTSVCSAPDERSHTELWVKHVRIQYSGKFFHNYRLMYYSRCYAQNFINPSRYTDTHVPVVSCPPRARLPARNGLVNEVKFLGLISQNGGRPMRLRDR